MIMATSCDNAINRIFLYNIIKIKHDIIVSYYPTSLVDWYQITSGGTLVISPETSQFHISLANYSNETPSPHPSLATNHNCPQQTLAGGNKLNRTAVM